MDESTEEDARDPPTTPTNTREGSGSGPNSGKSPDSRPASPETQEIPGMFIFKIFIFQDIFNIYKNCIKQQNLIIYLSFGYPVLYGTQWNSSLTQILNRILILLKT